MNAESLSPSLSSSLGEPDLGLGHMRLVMQGRVASMMELSVGGGNTIESRWHSSRVPGRIQLAMKNGEQIRRRRERAGTDAHLFS